MLSHNKSTDCVLSFWQGPAALRDVRVAHREGGPLREPGGSHQEAGEDLQEEPRSDGVGEGGRTDLGLRVSVAVQDEEMELQYGQRHQDIRKGAQ